MNKAQQEASFLAFNNKTHCYIFQELIQER